MTDDIVSSSANSSDSNSDNTSPVRRISTPRPKKVAKRIPVETNVVSESVAEVSNMPFPSPTQREETADGQSDARNDWPDSESDSGGSLSSQPESVKKKRRRRKGKGQSIPPLSSGMEPLFEESQPSSATDLAGVEVVVQNQKSRSPSGLQGHQQQQASHRSKVDPELVAKMAWKIYLAEVSEEGVALIGDHDAKDLARRCFRLAEIFIEEQSRRR